MRAIVAAGLLLPLAVAAVPSDLKVSVDDLPEHGEHWLEFHSNKTSGKFRLMPEYTVGIAPNWQASLKLPLAFERSRSRSNGLDAEARYVAPHDENAGPYWGVDFSLGYFTPAGGPRNWEAAFVPVFGYHLERWHFAANLGASLPLAGSEKKLNFAPAAKIAYRALEKQHVGLEYFLYAGPLSKWRPREEREEYAFLAWDGVLGKLELNAGIGRGLSDASDRWLFKLIVALKL